MVVRIDLHRLCLQSDGAGLVGGLRTAGLCNAVVGPPKHRTETRHRALTTIPNESRPASSSS
jgi:hypothetical protein